MQIPNFAAARDVASSPSAWASFCDAVGLNPSGRDTYECNASVRIVLCESEIV